MSDALQNQDSHFLEGVNGAGVPDIDDAKTDAMALKKKAKAFGLSPDLVRMLDPKARPKATAVEVNRAALARACAITNTDPTEMFVRMIELTKAKRVGRRVEPTVELIEEPLHERDEATGALYFPEEQIEAIAQGKQPKRQFRLIESGQEVPAMVDDTRVQATAIGMVMRLTGLDPGMNIRVEGMPEQGPTINILAGELKLQIAQAKESGDFEKLRELYRQQMTKPKQIAQLAESASQQEDSAIDAEFTEG